MVWSSVLPGLNFFQGWGKNAIPSALITNESVTGMEPATGDRDCKSPSCSWSVPAVAVPFTQTGQQERCIAELGMEQRSCLWIFTV